MTVDKVYTAKVPVDFEAGKNKSVQFAWKQTANSRKASYKIEIYHNGFKIGEGTRKLKKGVCWLELSSHKIYEPGTSFPVFFYNNARKAARAGVNDVAFSRFRPSY